ncbi:MAG TPA: hypothetical protein VK542_05940 [Gemmatimonadaceae bacterium]|nr:hypothetical protein [Gemmatimonadaceae bacterium]
MRSINILLVSVLILQTGCRGWIEKPIVPDTGIAIPRRGTLRVTKSDGTVISLRDSFITIDSIVGFASDTTRQPMAIARANVTKIEMRGDTTPQGLRTAGKIYLIWVEVVGAVGMTLIAIVLWR